MPSGVSTPTDISPLSSGASITDSISPAPSTLSPRRCSPQNRRPINASRSRKHLGNQVCPYGPLEPSMPRRLSLALLLLSPLAFIAPAAAVDESEQELE